MKNRKKIIEIGCFILAVLLITIAVFMILFKNNEKYALSCKLIDENQMYEAYYNFDSNMNAIDGKVITRTAYDKEEYLKEKELLYLMESFYDEKIAYNDGERVISFITDWDLIKKKNEDEDLSYDDPVYIPFTNFENLQNYYFANGYTCNGKRDETLINIAKETTENRTIIYEDKIYFIDYGYDYSKSDLVVANLDGKGKKSLKINNVDDFYFIMNNYLYYRTKDRNDFSKYYRVNLDNYNDIKSFGSELFIHKDELKKINDDRQKVVSYDHGYMIINGFPSIYNHQLIGFDYNSIYISNTFTYDDYDYQDEEDKYIIYEDKEGISVVDLAVHDDYVYAIAQPSPEDSFKIIKIDIKAKKAIETFDTKIIETSSMYSYYFIDYNDNGIVFFINNMFYKFDYNTGKTSAVFNEVISDENSDIINIFYYNNKIIYSKRIYDFNYYLPVNNSVVVYDEVTKEKKVHDNTVHFQVSLGSLYLVDREGKIIKESLD